MFRSKAKKSGARKRKELADSDEEAAARQVDPVAAEREQQQASAEAADDPAADEDAMLEQMRARTRKGKAKGAMSFSSKSFKVSGRARSGDSNGSSGVQAEVEGGLLSFEDDKLQGKAQSRGRKAKIRPNLVAANVIENVKMQEDAVRSQYSSEMLASLRQEQNVLLPSRPTQEEVGPEPRTMETSDPPMDVEMEEADVDMSIADESLPGEAKKEEEEFIPLQSQMMQRRRRKNRVTFGFDTHEPKLEKTAEVIEEDVSDDEEKEESQRWEEELMRRGGHHPVPAQPKAREDKKRAYPTRKKMSCLSLDSLLLKLDRSLEATEFENDRANRELARIEADISIIEGNFRSQREELLASSEEFEYFQVIEDFVKGLSFCVREKLPAIEAKEKEILRERVEAVAAQREGLRRKLVTGIASDIANGAIAESDVWGYDSLASKTDLQDAEPVSDFAEHFMEPYAPIRADRDVSSDVMEYFGDAIDEISSLDRVYGRFQEWKSKFPDIYRDSYCDLAAEKLYAPYVRAEMLSWDPLSVAMAVPGRKVASWSLDDFEWFRVLSRHLSGKEQSGSAGLNADGPLLYQVREFVVRRTKQAADNYFDPCSGLQTQSLVSILEGLARTGLVSALAPALEELVGRVLEAFSSSAKRFVLVAVDEATASAHKSTRLLAHHEIERFNALQDNLLNLFVALPADQASLQDAAFTCLMRVLHLVLSYLSLCRQSGKTFLVPLATQVVEQLASSSFLRQTLASSKREREWEHAMALFFPFLAASTASTSEKA